MIIRWLFLLMNRWYISNRILSLQATFSKHLVNSYTLSKHSRRHFGSSKKVHSNFDYDWEKVSYVEERISLSVHDKELRLRLCRRFWWSTRSWSSYTSETLLTSSLSYSKSLPDSDVSSSGIRLTGPRTLATISARSVNVCGPKMKSC